MKCRGYESLGGIDATQPLLRFAIIFGLSMDYELTRQWCGRCSSPRR
jgi:hypothetical protein